MKNGGVQQRLLHLLPATAVVVVLLLALILVYFLKNWLAEEQPVQKKIVQQVTIFTPPPPPPPPEEEPPEPEVKEDIEPEEVVEETPEEAEPAPGEDVAVDADGGECNGGQCIKAKKGGRDLLQGGPFAWYAGLMEREITDLLTEQKLLKEDEYAIKINLWINIDGSLSKIELLSSTGDKERDQALYVALTSINQFSQMPPGKMPQPVKLKITSSI